MKKRISILLIILMFYVVMAVVTIISPKVYRNSLPKVSAVMPEGYFTMENGESASRQLLPVKMRNQPIYVVELREKNGEIRMYAKLVAVEFADGEREDKVMVKSGLSRISVVIVEGMEWVADGGEVIVENKEEIKLWQ